jgi:hypothetical protein
MSIKAVPASALILCRLFVARQIKDYVICDVMDVRGDEVVLEHLLGCEQLCADVAAKPVYLFVDNINVVLPVALLGEGLVALLTSEHLFILMNCKR